MDDMNRTYARVFEGSDGQWYATVYGGNGEPIATTEGHKDRRDAVHGVEILGYPESEFHD